MPPKPKPSAWTDDDVKAEIREAVRIVHEDRQRATYAELHERFGDKPRDPDDPKPPPKEPTLDDVKPKRSIWWGETSDDDE